MSAFNSARGRAPRNPRSGAAIPAVPACVCPRGRRVPGVSPARLTEQRAYEDDDLRGGGELAVQRRLPEAPERARVGARSLGARRVEQHLAGVPGAPAAVMPHGEAGTPAPPPPASKPRGRSLLPTAGAEAPMGGPGDARAAAGPPHVSTSPAPAGRAGRRARLLPVPDRSRVPVSSHMKAARPETAGRRPSRLPGGQRGQAHSTAPATPRAALDGDPGRSPLPLPTAISAPPALEESRQPPSSPFAPTDSAPRP